jgi:hypothetical protein
LSSALRAFRMAVSRVNGGIRFCIESLIVSPPFHALLFSTARQVTLSAGVIITGWLR